MQGSYFLRREERSKEASTPSKASPYMGRDVTAPPRRSYIKVCSDHQRSGLIVLLTQPLTIVLIADLIRDLLQKNTDEIPARWPE